MKITKKLIASILAMVMLLCMNVSVFAEQTNSYTDQETVTINKKYTLTNNGTTSPRETFTLTQVDKKVTDGDATEAPNLGTITGATYDAGEATVDGTTAAITIQLPTYTNVGVYEYTLKEVAGTTAGVSYFSGNIKLVVTVINGDNGKLRVAGVHTETEGGTKSDIITNTYSAGTLNVSKTVNGILGDKTKYFEFNVTLTGENGKTYASSYNVDGGSNENNPGTIEIGEPTTFYLKDDETISIGNLPYGVEYTVTENDYREAGYTTTTTGDTGTIDKPSQTAAFTNTKGGTVDTGIYLNNLPYLGALAIVLVAAVVLIRRRRRA